MLFLSNGISIKFLVIAFAMFRTFIDTGFNYLEGSDAVVELLLDFNLYGNPIENEIIANTNRSDNTGIGNGSEKGNCKL